MPQPMPQPNQMPTFRIDPDSGESPEDRRDLCAAIAEYLNRAATTDQSRPASGSGDDHGLSSNGSTKPDCVDKDNQTATVAKKIIGQAATHTSYVVEGVTYKSYCGRPDKPLWYFEV